MNLAQKIKNKYQFKQKCKFFYFSVKFHVNEVPGTARK